MKSWSKLFSVVLTFMFLVSATFVANANPTERIANDYGIADSSVQDMIDSGWAYADINQAGFLALASGESIDTVVKYNAIAGSWKGTEALLGLTDWHVKTGQHKLIANQLNQIFHADKTGVESLLTQKYHPKAIAIAAALASKSAVAQELAIQGNKSKEKVDPRYRETAVEVVMGMKMKQGDTWVSWTEIGEKLGLSNAEVFSAINEFNTAMAERKSFGDSYGFESGAYGYAESDFVSYGYDIELVK